MNKLTYKRPERTPTDPKATKLYSSDLTGKTTRGIAWSLIGQVLNKGFTLLTLTILARLLTKADFGLIAATAIVIDLLSSYKDLGLGHALIQNREDVGSAANSVFTINLITGLALSTIVIVVSPVVAAYFESPEIAPLLSCLGLNFLINAFGAVHITLLKRDLKYREKLILDGCSALIKALVSISMALSGFGVWSLVAGQLAGVSTSSLLSWIIVPWRPRLEINRSIASRLIRYGASIMGISTLSSLTENLSFIIVGKICGIALLGVFSLSFRLPEVLLIGNLWVLSQVFFPMFAIIQTEPQKIRAAFLATIRLVSLIATPISLGLLLAADPLIRVMYGSQWIEAVPILQVMAVYAWVHSFGYHAGDIYKAIGRPQILLWLSLVALVIDLAALITGSHYGLIGISYGLLAGMLLNCGINLFVAIRLIKVSLMNICLELRSSLIGGLVLTSCTFFVSIATQEAAPIIKLAALTTAGGFSYLLVMWFFEKNNMLLILEKLGLINCLKQ